MGNLTFALLLGSLVVPFTQEVRAWEPELSFGIAGGYSDNATQSSTLKASSASIRPSVNLTLSDTPWNVALMADNESFLVSEIPGNSTLSIKPEYRTSFMDDALETRISYRISKNFLHVLSPLSLTSKKGGSSTVSDPTLYTTDAYLSHKGKVSSDYSFESSLGLLRLGAKASFEKMIYDNSAQRDDILSFGAELGWTPSETIDFTFSGGQTQTDSTVAGYSTSGPYVEGMALFSVTDSLALMTLWKQSSSDYVTRKDKTQTLLLGLEVALTDSTSFEGEYSRSSVSSNAATYSYDANELSAGLAFNF